MNNPITSPSIIPESEKWDLEIKPHSNLFDIRLKELWDYRDLLVLLIRRDFVSFYKQTIFGPIWFFVQPLFTTIIYAFIFGKLAGISTDGIPPALFYLSGITAWNYFSECLTKTSTVFRDNASVFGKVYFPRLIMPLSIVISNLLRFTVQLLLLLILMGYYFYQNHHSFHITPYILLFPILILMMALIGLGLGMLISAMTTKYRDLSFLVSFGVQLLMYATTVVYPLSVVMTKFPTYHYLISLNPMSIIIETFRLGFLGTGSFSWLTFSFSVGVTLVVTLFGIIVFNKVERNFIDTV